MAVKAVGRGPAEVEPHLMVTDPPYGACIVRL